MNTNEINWMGIAAIIIPSVATLLGSWLQARATRPTATPLQNQPKDSTSDTGTDTHLIKSRISASLMIGSPSAGLAYSFWAPGPPDKLLLVGVAFNVLLLSLGVSLILSMRYVDHRMRQWTDAITGATVTYKALLEDLNKHLDTLRESRKTFLEISELQRQRMNRLDETARRIERAKKRPPRP